ncbi:MAG: LytTR family DNA-binding domain-containing protein [Flavihumibacter sp.]
MIRILIVDDEPAAANMLRFLIEKNIAVARTIEICHSPQDALALIPAFRPTLLMLDIEMPQMSGFDLLNRATEATFDVIFTTAYDKYAIRAIRFSALDYLLKPIDIAELQNAINRHVIGAGLAKQHQRPLLQNLLGNLKNTSNAPPRLALATAEGTYFFEPADIIWCEGNNNYTHFHFTNHRPVIVSKTLKEYEEILGEFGFMRVHKSYLVNRQHITQLNKEGTIVMTDNSKLAISRRRKDEVLKFLKTRFLR